jgi:hypothetical protein
MKLIFAKKECEQSSDFCLALYDISLKFHNENIEFVKNEDLEASSFCELLLKTLPDTPLSDDLKSLNINSSFKDKMLEENGQNCVNQCLFESFSTYSKEVKPVCNFIYSQYHYLQTKKQNVKSTEKTASEQQQKSMSRLCEAIKKKSLVTLLLILL